MLPGANNSSTTGREVDTYDRGFGGMEGSGTSEGRDFEHERLWVEGKLTNTGYKKDGFVVGDDELEVSSDSDFDVEVRATEEEMSWLRGPLRTVERTGLDPLVEESQIPGAELDEDNESWLEGKETFLTEDEGSDYEEESSEEDEEDDE